MTTPIRITISDSEEHARTGMSGRTGTALHYFHDSTGRLLAVVELDPTPDTSTSTDPNGQPAPIVQIFSQFDIREDRP